MYAFVDETGNTGAKLLDEAQPLFITGALLTRSDFDQRFGKDVSDLTKACGIDEIHATEMGVGGLEAIAPDILKILRKAGPTFAIARVEKTYVVARRFLTRSSTPSRTKPYLGTRTICLRFA